MFLWVMNGGGAFLLGRSIGLTAHTWTNSSASASAMLSQSSHPGMAWHVSTHCTARTLHCTALHTHCRLTFSPQAEGIFYNLMILSLPVWQRAWICTHTHTHFSAHVKIMSLSQCVTATAHGWVRVSSGDGDVISVVQPPNNHVWWMTRLFP